MIVPGVLLILRISILRKNAHEMRDEHGRHKHTDRDYTHRGIVLLLECKQHVDAIFT